MNNQNAKDLNFTPTEKNKENVNQNSGTKLIKSTDEGPPLNLLKEDRRRNTLKIKSTTIRLPGEKLIELASLLLQVTQGDYKGTLSCLNHRT